MNVEHLVRGWLEKLVHLQLFQVAQKLPRHLVGILKKQKKKQKKKKKEKRKNKKALNVRHWTFERDEK